MASKILDQEPCIGCGTCVRSCLMDNIRLNIFSKKPEVKNIEDCDLCYHCDLQCAIGNNITITTFNRIKPVFAVAWSLTNYAEKSETDTFLNLDSAFLSSHHWPMYHHYNKSFHLQDLTQRPCCSQLWHDHNRLFYNHAKPLL